MAMPAKWTIASQPDARLLAEKIGVRWPVAAALINRGISSPEQAAAFLKPSLSSLSNPSLMAHMDKAVARTMQAIEHGERICIYGDYDADGMTATALLSSFFKEVGISVDRFVPTRSRDGYGVNAERIQELARKGVSLILTVDCGTSSHSEVALARSLGVDIIILDHHEPGPSLPNAVAVVNPTRSDCPFPFKYLAAVGVAFYFAGALRRALWDANRLPRGKPDLRALLDLVAVGTIADVAPLVGDNRVFATIGLKILNENPRVGFTALKAVSGVAGRPVTAWTVGFQIAPRLNATGRLSDPATSVALLLASDMEEAKRHAETLDTENTARRRIENEVLSSAMQQIEGFGGLLHKALVVAGEGWHPGVVGIVASKLVETFRRPAVVIGIEDGVGRGSCRSIKGFNIGKALSEVSSLLIRHGGHPLAAGLVIEPERIPSFIEAFCSIADREISDEMLEPPLEIDAVLDLAELDMGLLQQLNLLAPHGLGNPEPVFACLDCPVLSVRLVGQDRSHVQLVFGEPQRSISAIWFGGAEHAPEQGKRVDVAFSLIADELAGAPKMKVRSIRTAG